MPFAADLISKQTDIINTVGTTLNFESATGGAQRSIRGAIIPFGKYDGELINALGIEGRKIQIGAINPAPVKFDRVTEPETGMIYTIEDVRAAVVDGTLIGYTCIARAT